MGEEFFSPPLFPFKNNLKANYCLVCFALFFNSLVLLGLSLPLPPPSMHTGAREALAKTVCGLFV